MARKKSMERGTCAFCGQRFVKHRSWALYCNDRCSDKAKRQRAAPPIPANPMPDAWLAATTVENTLNSICSQARSGAECREESDDYREVVAILNPTLRLIKGRCGLQWIVQEKTRPSRWESIDFCGTKEGLLLRVRCHLQHLHNPNERTPLGTLADLYCDPDAWDIIEVLPDFYPKARAAKAQKVLENA